MVEYHPITAKDQSRLHPFGKNVLLGLFLGYALYPGGIWKGDVLVADLEELETMDASEIYSKRLNAKEVIFPEDNGKFIFPVADGRINRPGGDQDLRTSTLIRHRPIQGERNIDFLGLFHNLTTRFRMPVKQSMIFGPCQENSKTAITLNPESNFTRREKNHSLKYIDVSRTVHTNLDVKQEKRIDDYWNIDGSRDLSDPWTGFTQFLLYWKKNLPTDICGPGRD